MVVHCQAFLDAGGGECSDRELLLPCDGAFFKRDGEGGNGPLRAGKDLFLGNALYHQNGDRKAAEMKMLSLGRWRLLVQ